VTVDRSSISPELERAIYRSKFGDWNQRASVRNRPRRVLSETGPGLYFPPEAVPILDHPLVRARGSRVIEEILLQRLHVYLDFTAELEQRAVNPVCAAISRRRSGFDLPPDMLADAYKIYTDEAWHAQFSDDMQRQIIDRTGVSAVLPATPAFMQRLAKAQEEAGTDPALSALFFTIVSETLISAILSDIPADGRLDLGVRQLVADHAADERVHHAYFAKVLPCVWSQLGPREQRAIAQQLPEFIHAFLDPDYEALAGILGSLQFTQEETSNILADSYDASSIAEENRLHAHLTLRHFADVGILDDPAALEGFQVAGLVGDNGYER